MSEFKVGDLVKIARNDTEDIEDNRYVGLIGKVIGVDTDLHYSYTVEMLNADLEDQIWSASALEHFSLLSSSLTDIVNVITEDTKGANMAVSPKELRELKLPEAERLLREAGYKDDTGAWTEAGREVLLDRVAVDQEASIVADLKALKKAKETK